MDRHAVQPSEFRTEQLVGDQVGSLRRLGVLDVLLDGQASVEIAVGYRGRTQIRTEKAPHYGLPYALMVRRLRSLVPEMIFDQGEVLDLRSEQDRMRVVLRDQEIECRFVVLATGLNRRLADRLSLRRLVLSKQHSFVLGINLEVEADRKDILVQYGTPETSRQAISASSQCGASTMIRVSGQRTAVPSKMPSSGVRWPAVSRCGGDSIAGELTAAHDSLPAKVIYSAATSYRRA